jgi:hypothetical protein
MVKYTKGKGSSIKEDTAFHILNSIYYAVNAYIENQESSSRFSLTYERDVLEIYDEGIEILKKTVCECEKLYEKIKENRLHVPIQMYNDTIDTALPDFFSNYDIIFGAQDTYSSMDYPIVFDDMNMAGIFYIKQYLEKLKLETEFCNFFPQSSLLKILRDYGEKYKINISKSPINVFQVLADQCVFLALGQGYEKDLTMSQVQFKIVNKNLSGKSEHEILSLLDTAFEKIIDDLHIKELGLMYYVNRYKDSFKFRLLASYNSGNLSNMVVLEKKKNKKDKVVFKEGTRLSNYDFSVIVEEISKCQDIENKIDIIKQNIHSTEDYMDLLDSECLFGDEYKQIFKCLDDITLALFGTAVFYDELECGSFKLTSEQLMNCRGNMERQWQNYYVDFLLGQEEKRIKDIEKMITYISCR